MAADKGDKESFDLPVSWVGPGSGPAAPASVLTSDKVDAVRFQPAKPGYAFEQVETFVDQVKETLGYLEGKAHQSEVTLREAREENLDLQERNMNLQATIEVFRAKGDPVRGDDGSYLTQSQVAAAPASSAELDAARAEAAALREQLAAAHAELETLGAALAESRADAERGWTAESELRSYLDETLMPWIAEQMAAAEAVLAAAASTEQAEPAETEPGDETETGDGVDDEVLATEAFDVAAAQARHELPPVPGRRSRRRILELAPEVEALAGEEIALPDDVDEDLPAPAEEHPPVDGEELPAKLAAAPELHPDDEEDASAEQERD